MGYGDALKNKKTNKNRGNRRGLNQGDALPPETGFSPGGP